MLTLGNDVDSGTEGVAFLTSSHIFLEKIVLQIGSGVP